MRKISVFVLGIFLITIFSSFFNFFDTRTPSTKMAHKIVKVINKRMKLKYGLNFMGISEAGPDGRYTNIGFMFSYSHILSKEQGRCLILQVSQDILKAFNSYPQFKQHMANVPFTYDNISVSIFIQLPKGPDVSHPDIGLFGFLNHILRFQTYDPKNFSKEYLVEEETYEEALRKSEIHY